MKKRQRRPDFPTLRENRTSTFITRPISGVLYSIVIGEWHARGDKKLP